MKILYLTDEFPPESYGGAGIVACDFAKAVARKGHKVFIITTTRNRSLEEESVSEGLKIFRLYSRYPIFLRHYISVYNPFLNFFLSNKIRSSSFSERVVLILSGRDDLSSISVRSFHFLAVIQEMLNFSAKAETDKSLSFISLRML